MINFFDETEKKITRSRFQRHLKIFIWKSYQQRHRRWRALVAQSIFAGILYLIAVFTAKPVFLTPLRAEPEPPLTSNDLLKSLNKKIILGYAPNVEPYASVMARAATLLKHKISSAATEDDLNSQLFKQSQIKPIDGSVIWIIWKPTQEKDVWKCSIRSTERAQFETRVELTEYTNPHLRAGFLAVQQAVSQAVLERSASPTSKYEINLISMPVSPLMQGDKVRKALSGILRCFTFALLPPVLETVALVVHETQSRYKRALLIRGVDYSMIYIGWIAYALLTALPICLLGAITLILIFRWIHIVFALVMLLAYVSVMIMLALIMAMFHDKAWIACIWTTLFTVLQMYLAELLAHHRYDSRHEALTFMMNILLPPLGLVHAFNQFALLQIGREEEEYHPHLYTLISWGVVILLYFSILMLLQRTISQDRAIGGQVSWTSIIFKKAEDANKLHAIETPTGDERDRLQEVDQFVAKAISFRGVSKSIMGNQLLSNATFDIYRGEFTMLFAQRNQDKMIITIEDLLTDWPHSSVCRSSAFCAVDCGFKDCGFDANIHKITPASQRGIQRILISICYDDRGLTYADKGTIHVFGQELKAGTCYMAVPHMMGYCHRSAFLVEDLTVQEHLTLFYDICLWSESRQYIAQYSDIRAKHLLADCDLERVRHEQVRYLDDYYRAQLCWAIAVMLEPKVVVMPNLIDTTGYVSVLKDKIMQHKRYMAIVKMCFSSMQLEYADRVFLFDSKILVFGGTPAYMFFKYGREYRVRMTLRSDATIDDEATAQLLQRAAEAGASIRSHLGSLLILRLPTSPTENVANLVIDLTKNAGRYGVTSLHISLPDSEEVSRRAIIAARPLSYETPASYQTSKEALKRIAEPIRWKREITYFSNLTQLRYTGWKYFTFFVHYRMFLLITLGAAVAAGLTIGYSFSFMLADSNANRFTKMLLHGELLTVEYADQKTTLVIRLDNSSAAISIANAYVLSEPKATAKEVAKITYTALPKTESLTEYLVTRAIDSPQMYVYMYAYGLDVFTNANGTLIVQALYSPLHYDYGAAPRSMARMYMALLRHYTQNYAASIQLTDDPLSLDLTPWTRYATEPPLFIQFLLIVCVAHITLMPSKEYGLIRHIQSHAMNFSPARYWLTLYFCDLILYWMLVGIMTSIMMLIMYLRAPTDHFELEDLLAIPVLLIIYGVGCIPQAYLFSLGPRVALNAMTFVIVNIALGQTTIIARIFYKETLDLALLLMSWLPQFNLAYALVKIKKVFLYNSECRIFRIQKLCSSKTLHTCCQKCGILQKCFAKKAYLSRIRSQMVALITTATLFVVILLLIEYKVAQRLWKLLVTRWIVLRKPDTDVLMPGAAREKKYVLEKRHQMESKRNVKIMTFGEYLLVQNLARKEMGTYTVHSVYLGVGKGEAVALSGLKRHGRLKLCEMLVGYKMASKGHAWSMSKWKQETQPHKYAQQISFGCERQMLPSWMSVYDALEMIALLRGVPKKHVKTLLRDHIEALELQSEADHLICRVAKQDLTRIHFAAAVVGAPPVIVLDEYTAYQKFSVRRAMYYILNHMKKRGHAVFICSSSVESHMPVTNRLAILLDGCIYDIDTVDNIVSRYSAKGYTVVVHFKDVEVNATKIFERYFKNFVINDTSEVLVNIQILDTGLTWATIFQTMETLKTENNQVYSYIVTVICVDYIYNSILLKETGRKTFGDFLTGFKKKAMRTKFKPSKEKLAQLMPFEQKYDITKLKELPWSVIFHR